MTHALPFIVIPAKAGIPGREGAALLHQAPAFVGATACAGPTGGAQ
jgi:hypothetical protein